MAIINGTSLANVLNGTASDDTINGLAGNDTLNGLGGNDTLDGGTGNDTMAGGIGNDTYIVDSASDIVTEAAAAGTDTVRASVTYSLATRVNVENLVLTGTAAINGTGNTLANVITGNGANNVLNGGTGSDTLIGGLGNDTLIGGLDNDTYVVDATGDVVTEAASAGTDTIQSAVTISALAANVENLTLTGAAATNGLGNALSNVITGNAAGNILLGDAGNDTLNGGAGADILIGDVGNDTYVVNSADDLVIEFTGDGTDTVQSAITWILGPDLENLTLTGAAAIHGTGNSLNNVIVGNTANNLLLGGDGNDTLTGGAGDDVMLGGAGNDIYVVDRLTDILVERPGEGTDTVQSAITWTLGANLENLMLTGAAAVNGTGNALANVLTGNGVNNVLTGGDGNDTLSGGAGNDTLVGGLGNDTYVVDVVTDVITEGASAGTDTVQAGFTYTIAALVNVENLTLTGAAAINGTGNLLANVITGNGADNILTGNDGNDTLNGGLGDDILIGGLGDDTYVVNAVGDVVAESVNMGGGTDAVQSSIDYTLGENVELLELLGMTLNGTGNALDNVITGNLANNTLSGGDGNDTLFGSIGEDMLIGGAGNDSYYVETPSDIVMESGGMGGDTVFSSATEFLLPDHVESLTLLEAGNINGTGNGEHNVLTGNSDSNVLAGGAGNDTIDGGAGADFMYGGPGDDIYVVDNLMDDPNELDLGGAGTDTVQSSIPYTLPGDIENLVLTGMGDIDGTGNNLANILTGNAGNNTLDGGQDANVLNGAGGNDILVYRDYGTGFGYHGGDGEDTLKFIGSTQELEIFTSAGGAFTDIEVIDLTGTGNNTLTANLSSVFAISSTSNTLRVDGNMGDVVDMQSDAPGTWTQQANILIGMTTYRVYTAGMMGTATLQVEDSLITQFTLM